MDLNQKSGPPLFPLHSPPNSRLPQRAGCTPLQSDRLGAWWLCRDPLGFRNGLAVQSTRLRASATPHWIKISFMRGMSETSGVVRTERRVLKAGRRIATVEARITDAKGRLFAHATTTCLVFEISKGNAKG